MLLEKGTQVDRYVLAEELGRGGFGTVFRAVHSVTGGAVALKILRRATGDGGARFIQEARATCAIEHPAIVSVTDVGVTEQGLYFMAMELLEGRSLAETLKERGPLSETVVASFAVEVLSALAAAHRVGIVHRDLKPSNIFLADRPGREPEVKILDFGISKVDKPWTQVVRTNTGVSLGTPHYAAPEQLMAERTIDGRADLYALSVVLYKMLSGQLPITAQSQGHLLLAVLEQPPAPLRSLVPNVSPRLEAVVMRGLAKESSDRWPNAEAMAEAIHGASAQAPVTRMTAPAPTQQVPAVTQPPTAPRQPTRVAPAPSKIPRALIVLGLGLIGLVGLGAVLLAVWAASTPSSTPTAAEGSPLETPLSSGVPLGSARHALLALESSGCQVLANQPLEAEMFPSSNMFIVIWDSGPGSGSSLTIRLPPGRAGALQLSTLRHPIEPSLTIANDEAVWTTAGAPVPSSGVLHVNEFDLAVRQVDLRFENVTISRMNSTGVPEACQLNGQITMVEG